MNEYYTTFPFVISNQSSINNAIKSVVDYCKNTQCCYSHKFDVRSGEGRRFTTHGRYQVYCDGGEHILQKLED